MCEIDFRFTTKSGEYPGAYFRDYFKDDGYNRALEAETTTEAYEILESTYLGPDIDGVGVKWDIESPIARYEKTMGLHD